MSTLPDPRERPLMRPVELVGLIPGKGRSAVYAAVGCGDLPSISINGRLFVPTAALYRLFALEVPGD